MYSIVRRVLPHEYGKYKTHLQALDAQSKHLRFGTVLSDSIIEKFCDRLDPYKHILFCVEDTELNFIGVGHISLENGMELAFSVFKEHQGRGLGSSLMKRCIQWCRTNNILKGCMVCLPHNRVIKHLCSKHGIHLSTEQGETTAAVSLDKPSIDTYVSEGVASNLAIIDYAVKRTWSLINPNHLTSSY